MVSTAVIAAAAGVAGTLLGSSITAYANYRANAQRLKEERKRVQAEIHSQRQLDVLMDLHSELDDMGDMLISINGLKSSRFSKEREELRDQFLQITQNSEDFLKDMSPSRVFLSEHTDDLLKEIISISYAMQLQIMRELAPDGVESRNEVGAFYEVDFNEGSPAWEMSQQDLHWLSDEGMRKIHQVQSTIQERIRGPIKHVEPETRERRH